VKINLGARYSIVISGAILIIVAILSVLQLVQYQNTSEQLRQISSDTMRDNLVNQILQRGESVSSVLVERLVNPVYRLDMLQMYELIDETAKLPGVSYVYLVDTDNRIIHDGTRDVAAYGQRWGTKDVADTNGEAVFSVPDSPEALQISNPVSLADTELGVLYLGMSLAPVVEKTAAIDANLGDMLRIHQSNNIKRLIAYSVVLLLAGTLLALMISRLFARPIRQLAQFAVDVGQGQYVQPPHVDRADEIGLLATSLNEMSTNLRQSIGEAEFLAYHDSLTRLPNRAQLKRLLRAAIDVALNDNTSLAILLVDLDDFKNINDTLGHEAGDEFLQAFAHRLSDSLVGHESQTAVVAPLRNATLTRLGGDEFTIVLEHVDSNEAAERAASYVLNLLMEPFNIKGHPITVSASIGITFCPEHSDDMSELLRGADIAMYEAKARGGNRYRVYEESMDSNAARQFLFQSGLYKAITTDEL